MNPVDYKIWSLMPEWVYKHQINNINELRQHIMERWDSIEQRVIDAAVNQWCT